MKTTGLQTRREFLRTTVLGSAATWTVPAFVHLTMRSLHAEALHSATQHVTGRDDTILVILQLAGGNDGLNTLVPWANDYYYQARPRLAIPQSHVLKLNDAVGFHPALGGLQHLYDTGRLAIIQGAGYPNPNRSHFRSMEIWQTATDADRFERHGWIGRFFDHQCAGMDATSGIHLTGNAPQAFSAQRPKGVSLGLDAPRRGIAIPPGFDFEAATGGSIDQLGTAALHANGEAPLDFLERTAMDAQVSAEQIAGALRAQPAARHYPGHRLGREMQIVGRLIAGGMTTRIYYLSQGGYDTHVNQAATQERLLGEMGNALRAFIQDLETQGNLDRVVVMLFSEFGRRVQENANDGTDHGAAAPVFIAGGAVQGGIYAPMPSLAPENLSRGDLRHTVDFRSIYATVLDRHLRAPHAPILGRDFPLMDFI